MCLISSKKRQAFLLLLGTAVVFLAVGSATADPTQIHAKQQEAQQVLQQIQLIDGELTKASDRVEAANYQLERIRAELKSNAHHLVLARGSLKDAQSHLAGRLVSMYTNDESGSALEVILGAQNLDDLLARLDAIERVSKQDDQTVHAVKLFKAEVQARKARLTKARADQQHVVAEREAQKRAVEGELASRQQLLASIKSQIQQLQAEEAQRQAELKAQAERRLQAARLAAQAQAQVQAQAAAAPSTALSDITPNGSTPDATSAPVPASQYSGVVGIAMQYLGTPYVWGGASPGGFDCSGLAMYAFAQVGVSLPHNAAAQYGYGTPVSRD